VGLPLEDLYDEQHDLRWTGLTEADGTPISMWLETVPMAYSIITPLQKAREERSCSTSAARDRERSRIDEASAHATRSRVDNPAPTRHLFCLEPPVV
jgi:hypothetical protein